MASKHIAFFCILEFVSLLTVNRCFEMSEETDYQMLDDFNVTLKGITSVVFEVRTCHDARLLLMHDSTNFDGQLYEIIIGGWNNTKSAIRKERTDQFVDIVKHQPLDCKKLLTFWISWDERNLQVGKGSVVAEDEFMTFNYSIVPDLQHIGVSSGYWIFENDNCDCCIRKLHHCQELQKSGISKSGVYHVKDIVRDELFEVYCDMETDNGGWLVFQRRDNGSEDFYRDWNDYENGFGDMAGEFWLGNRHLLTIVSKGDYEMRIDLEDWSGDILYAKYNKFDVGNSCDNYRLTVSGYSGDAGDALGRSHSGFEFSTKDRDNDIHEDTHCARRFPGGWWYSNCLDANLNGLYSTGQRQTHGNGVCWNPPWTGLYYSLKRTKMMIREKCLP